MQDPELTARPLKQRAASRTSAQSAGVLGATPRAFTAQINQTFAFRGQLVSVSFEC